MKDDSTVSQSGSLSKVSGILELSGAGVTARAKGYRVMDLVCIGSLLGVMYMSFAIAQHDKEDSRMHAETIAIELKSRADSVKVITDSNTEVVRVLKENVAVQKEMNYSIQQLICIMSIPQEVRTGRGDFCRKIARGEIAYK